MSTLPPSPVGPAHADDPPAGATLWDLFKRLALEECLCAGNLEYARELERAWAPLHPGVSDHPALPGLREYVREQWGQGARLDRQICFDLRDRLRARRGLTEEQAERFPLEHVVAALCAPPVPVVEPTDDPVELLHRAIRHERRVLELLSSTRQQHDIDWQGGIDRLWQRWRELLPDIAPPARTRCDNPKKAQDGVDDLLRALNAMHPAPRSKPDDQTGGATPPPASKRAKGKNINEKMLAALQNDPASLGWSARQWADHLKCSTSTIADTTAWNVTIRAARAIEKADRRGGRSGK